MNKYLLVSPASHFYSFGVQCICFKLKAVCQIYTSLFAHISLFSITLVGVDVVLNYCFVLVLLVFGGIL